VLVVHSWRSHALTCTGLDKTNLHYLAQVQTHMEGKDAPAGKKVQSNNSIAKA
jgi:hypothetical protein